MKKFVMVICSVLLVGLFAGLASAADKPNVIYILADDLGYGDLSCYGQTKIQTPNIDRLAIEGMKFTAHYSGNTVCSPSRAVLMTGMHAGHCHVRGNVPEIDCALDPDMTVLAELYKQAGYATGAYGKWGMGITCNGGKESPLVHGFDEYAGWKSQSIAHTYFPSSVIVNDQEIPLAKGTYVHDILMNMVYNFIERNAKADKPFFCYVPTAIPHAAMQAPKELHEKWRKVFPQFDDRIGKYGAGPTEICDDVVNPIAGFAAMMEHLDSNVGHILDMLKELGIDDNTIVMFASDNGAHAEGGHDMRFWNSTGGLRGMKRDMHEGGIRTPFLVRWPGVVAEGSCSDHLSAFWDVMATSADLLGVELPEQCDGISFLPTLKGQPGKQKQHKYLYWEFHKGRNLFSHALRMGKWKVYAEKGKAIELFDLDKDPFEQNDIAADNPEVVKKAKKYMKEASKSL